MIRILFILLVCCSSAHGGVRDGSTIFWHGGLLVGPIYKHTGSKLTHVAIVLYHGRSPWVYEATPPVVRCMPFDKYIEHLKDLETRRFWQVRDFSWFIVEPTKPYGIDELHRMKVYAKAQLGRPYRLRGWWLNREGPGIFCSQYVGNIIEKSGRIESWNYKESPVSLYRKLK